MKKQKLYLSNTSIRTFLDCNKKFQYQYIDKINVTKSRTTKHLSFGKSIHATLAKFNMLTDTSQRTLDTLHDLLRKNWVREGYESIDEEREFGIKGLDMLTNYFNNPLDQGKENLIIEETIYENTPQYILCGKLDKVYVAEDDTVEILDYKTGNSIQPIDHLQLPIYLILAKSKLGFYPKRISSYYLAKSKKITQDIDDILLTELTTHIYELCQAISDNKCFEHKYTPYCQTNCQFYSLCKILSLRCTDSLNLKIKSNP
ncbi:MAG: PD-(D/E)XK nuclease family protein [Marinisporobacter sp.]|jgi:CRISPR/Cas system-associated exonuclease Cas4 (RecB family)|nr:PD-(D/E)XK nuclease family protein [Marinisporobacter sp.]